MLMSFIAGLVFGIGSGMFEKAIRGPLRKQMEFSDTEIGILSFSGLMLLAAIVVSAVGVNSSAFWLVLGGAIGAFSIRSFIFGKSKMEERKLAAAEKAEAMADEAADMAADAKDAAANAVEDAVDGAKDATASAVKKAKKAVKKSAEPA